MKALFLLLVLAGFGHGQSNDLAKINLASPLDFQVFQREIPAAGRIVIEGAVELSANVAAQPDALAARLVGASLPDGALPWQPLPLDLRVRRFRAEFAAPAGGWYRLEVRLTGGGKQFGDSVIEHVGVGEVFLVAGQSNAANHGEGRQRPNSPLVVAFGNGRWQPARDPQPGASGNGGSFLPAFGDAMAARFQVPIGLVALGVGATSVREWLPKGDTVAAPPTTGANTVATGSNAWASVGALYLRLIDTAATFGPGGFRAVLWHQGESDNHQPPDREISPAQYRQYLQRVIEASRAAAGWRVPWFVAQVSYHTPDDAGSPELRAAQKSLVASGLVLAGPNTDELGAAYRENNGRGVHFNARGLQLHGERWAECVGPWLEQQLKSGTAR